MSTEDRKPVVSIPPFKKGFFANIPRNLDVEGPPELRLFPFNVLFASMDELGKAVTYYPDLSTYCKDGDCAQLKYFNKMDQNWWLKIEFSWANGFYTGYRCYRDTILYETTGPGWKGFFIHLTLMGLVDGEPLDPIYEELAKDCGCGRED